MKNYDFIVIGSGAGTKIARAAASKGFSTAIIEKDELGGTCLNKGCIPSKMLIHPADIMLQIRYAKIFNISHKDVSINFSKLTREITNSVGSTSKSIKEKYENGKVKNLDFYYGNARFKEDKVIEVNGKTLRGNKIILATGAKPSIPPIPGLKDTPYWTSKNALRSTFLPPRLTILGGGYIGVELGHAYEAFGSKVHFITMGGFVGTLDKDIHDEFLGSIAKRFKSDEGTTTHVSYDKEKKEFTLKVKTENTTKTVKSDALLIATGVKPNTSELDLEKTSVKTDKRGFIRVNKHLETGCPGIYALGDCVGNYMFRHSANFEAEYLIELLVNTSHTSAIKYPPMPWAIFTNPQIAGVGLSEGELQEKGIEYVVGKNEYKHSAMGDALRSKYGFVKLLFEKKTQKLLGAFMIGEEASTMIHMCIVLLSQKAKLKDFFSFIYIHPALPENVRNAARNAKKEFEE